MPAFHVSESIIINAPATEVRKSLADYNQWPIWSPWLYMEKDTKVDYRGQSGQIGHGFDWSGKLVGAGGMTLTQNDPGELKMDLVFLKPFKSTAKVRFDITESGSDNAKTNITWHMDSSLPFFMFFMVGTMTSMIGMDYQRGLKMLKEFIETGAIRSRTEVNGIVDVPHSVYLGTTNHSAMADLGASMQKTIPAVFDAVTNANFTVNGATMSIYNQMNMKTRSCTYTAAIPVSDPSPVESPMHIGEISPCRALKVTHTGSYDHLANAWATAIGNQRDQKLKPSKQQPPFEIYVSDPGNTPEEQLVTEIYVPLKN